mgnify:CR=1 FL=1
MRVLLRGTGGPGGWPQPGCRCASCGRLTPGHRRPASIVADDLLRLAPEPGGAAPGLVLAATADGWTATGPDGARVLYAGADASGDPAPPCDLVLIDVLDRPGRLGDLRRRGVAHERTLVVAVGIDHRVSGEAELARRLGMWGVLAVPDGTVLEVRPGEVRVHAPGEAPGAAGPAGGPPPRRTLLLGGSGSGKSAEAELRLAALPEVVYVATGPSGADDPEWRARVRAHRERRPAHWRTVETVDVAGLLRADGAPLLVDGLGTWLAAVFDRCGAWESRAGDAEVARHCDELVAAWRNTARRVVAVSDEVGLGVVPATASGRRFRDALGRLNQRLAAESEEAALVVAGRPLPLPA